MSNEEDDDDFYNEDDQNKTSQLHYKCFIKEFNESLKSHWSVDEQIKRGIVPPERLLEKFPTHYLNCYLPKQTSIQWKLELSQLIDGRIVIVAHSKVPKRALGIIKFDPKISDAIPLRFRYKLVKLCPKTKKVTKVEFIKTLNKHKKMVTKKKEKIGVEVVLEKSSKPSLTMANEKRGFFLILQSSFEANITETNMNDHMETLLGWYNDYVNGMEKVPAKTYGRNEDDIDFEQFMLDRYPTESWKRHVNVFNKKNRKRKFNYSETDPVNIFNQKFSDLVKNEQLLFNHVGLVDNIDQTTITNKSKKNQLSPITLLPLPPPPPPPPPPFPNNNNTNSSSIETYEFAKLLAALKNPINHPITTNDSLFLNDDDIDTSNDDQLPNEDEEIFPDQAIKELII